MVIRNIFFAPQVMLVALTTLLTAALPVVHADGASNDKTSDTLSEVFITAQRREQNLLDVPVAVTVLSGDLIEKADIHDLEGVASRTPSLHFSPFWPGSNAVTMRGVSSLEQDIGLDSSVAIYIDDAYLGKTSTASVVLTDIERIEVLRGSQGVLYGRNAIGGAVRIISRKPDLDHAGGSVSLTSGNYELRSLSGHYSTPVGERWALRFSGSTRVRDGWVNSPLRPNDNLNNQNVQTARFQTLYQGARTSVRFGIDASFHDVDDTARIYVGEELDATSQITSTLPISSSDVAFKRFGGFGRRNASAVSIRVNHSFTESISLFYISSLRRSFAEAGNTLESPGLFVSPLEFLDSISVQQHEVRVSADWQRWTMTAGLSRVNDETDENNFIYLNEVPVAGRLAGFLSQASVFRTLHKSESLALHGLAEFTTDGSFYTSFGGRLTVDERKISDWSNSASFTQCPNVVTEICMNLLRNLLLPAQNNSSITEELWGTLTADLVLGFRLGAARNHHLYLDTSAWVRDNRAASVDGNILPSNSSASESVYIYEVGYKGQYNTWRGLTTRLGVSAFSTVYRHIFSRGISNAGLNPIDAVINGLELEMEFKSSAYFFIALTLAYSESHYRIRGSVFSLINNQLDDDPVLRTPEFKGSILVGGDVRTSCGHLFSWLADFRHESKTLHEIDSATGVSPAHTLFDVRLSWTAPQMLELALWTRNIGDSRWVNSIFPFVFSSFASYGNPYTYGVTAKYSF